jgi:hypothetical protein
MSTDLAVYTGASLDEKRQYAQTIAAAGDLLPKSLWAPIWNEQRSIMENRPSPGKVLLLVETGLMLGLHPMAALQGIDVIEGNPTLKPALMSALIRDAGHTLRIQQTGTVEGGDLAVTVTGIRKDDPEYPYVYTWRPIDAVRAGLLDSYSQGADGVWVARARSDKGGIKPWEAYTARMCRWRALGDVASAGFEDVLLGMHLTPEELGATVDADGEVVATPEEPTAAAPAVDWKAQIDAATTREAVVDIRDRAAADMTDDLRTAILTKLGRLGRVLTEPPVAAAATEPAPVPDTTEEVLEGDVEPAQPEDRDMTEEEYEAASRAEFDAQQLPWNQS